MTTGREIIISGATTQDRTGGETVTRQWRTEAKSQPEAALWLQQDQAVSVGSPYPSKPWLLLDSVSYTPDADGTYTITGRYSSAGLYVFDPIKKTNTDTIKYSRWRFGTYDYTIDVPWQMKIRRVIPGTVGNTVDVWTQNKNVVSKTDLVIEIELRVPKLTLADVGAIAAQASNIHKFPTLANRWWCFIGGNIQNVSDSEDLVTYTWRGDAGDPGYGDLPGQTPYNTQGGTVKFPNVVREQHKVWILVPDPNNIGNPSEPFLFDTAEQYTPNYNGYTTLPYLTQAVTL